MFQVSGSSKEILGKSYVGLGIQDRERTEPTPRTQNEYEQLVSEINIQLSLLEDFAIYFEKDISNFLSDSKAPVADDPFKSPIASSEATAALLNVLMRMKTLHRALNNISNRLVIA